MKETIARVTCLAWGKAQVHSMSGGLLLTRRGGCAGSDNNSTLVVMSKGTKWTQQSYKVDSTFPYEWIKKKWRENFYITSIGTAGPAKKQQWAVVMSRDADFLHQVVEMDFQYPSEGIHYHWEQGACTAPVSLSISWRCAVQSALLHVSLCPW